MRGHRPAKGRCLRPLGPCCGWPGSGLLPAPHSALSVLLLPVPSANPDQSSPLMLLESDRGFLYFLFCHKALFFSSSSSFFYFFKPSPPALTRPSLARRAETQPQPLGKLPAVCSPAPGRGSVLPQFRTSPEKPQSSVARERGKKKNTKHNLK